MSSFAFGSRTVDGENGGAGGGGGGAAAAAFVAVSGDAAVTAAGDGNLEALSKLLEKGAPLVDDFGYTALMAAVSYGHANVAQWLLQRTGGDDVNMSDNEGDTALHYCAEPVCLNLLLSAGADVNRKNAEGKTPIETALENFEEELCEGEKVEIDMQTILAGGENPFVDQNHDLLQVIRTMQQAVASASSQ